MSDSLPSPGIPPPRPRPRVAAGFWIALAACVAFGPSLSNDSIFDDSPQLRFLRSPPPEWLLAPREKGLLEEPLPAPGTPPRPGPEAAASPTGPLGCLASAAEPWWSPEKKKNVWRPAVRVLMNLEALAGRAVGLGETLLAFRLGALALHVAACLAVLAFARAARMPEGAGLAAGLILAVHPMRAEAVHQVVGQTETLAAFAMLAGLALRIRARDSLDSLDAIPSDDFVAQASSPVSSGEIDRAWRVRRSTHGRDARATRSLALARVAAIDCAAFALALGGKEHAILFPLYAMLAEAARRPRTRIAPCPRPGLRPRLRLRPRGLLPEAVSLVCMSCVAAAYLAGKVAVTGGLSEPPESVPAFENAIATLPFAQRVAPSLGILGFAAAKFLLPFGLVPDYSHETLPLLEGWKWEMAWLGAAILVGTCAWAIRDVRRGGRGWTLAVAGLAAWAMTSNLFFPIGVAAAQRLWYFPMIAPALAIGWAWARWRARVMAAADAVPSDAARNGDGDAGARDNDNGEGDAGTEDPARRRPALALFAAVAVLSALTFRSSPDWKDLTGWAQAVHRSYPQCHRANQVLSWLCYERREFPAGLAHARDAVRVYPFDADAWVWLGLNANMFLETRAEAEDAFQRALVLDPKSQPALRGLGTLLKFSDRDAEAEIVWREARRLEALEAE